MNYNYIWVQVLYEFFGDLDVFQWVYDKRVCNFANCVGVSEYGGISLCETEGNMPESF